MRDFKSVEVGKELTVVCQSIKGGSGTKNNLRFADMYYERFQVCGSGKGADSGVSEHQRWIRNKECGLRFADLYCRRF